MLLLRILVVLLIGVSGSAGAQQQSCADGSIEHPDLPVGFIDGDYVLVGREPDGGPSYHGRARISSDGCAVTVERSVDGARTSATGGWKRLDHPGGAIGLEFATVGRRERWHCRMSVDLDNHARLTCYRLLGGAEPLEPGVEAYFPTATWPDTAPNKSYR